MGEEEIKMYVSKISKLVAQMEQCEVGSEERESILKEIETYQKLLTEGRKVNQQKADSEEKARVEKEKIEAESARQEKQLKADKRRTIFEVGKAVAVALISGGIAFLGLKSNQAFIEKSNEHGDLIDKNISAKDPKFPWFGR